MHANFPGGSRPCNDTASLAPLPLPVYPGAAPPPPPASRHAGALAKYQHVLITLGPDKTLHTSLQLPPAVPPLSRGAPTASPAKKAATIGGPLLTPARPTKNPPTAGPRTASPLPPRARVPSRMDNRRGGYHGPSNCGSAYGQPGLDDGVSDLPVGPRGGVSRCACASVTVQSGAPA